MGQIGAVGGLQLLTALVQMGLEPLLAVVEVSVFVLNYGFGDFTGKGIGYGNINVISGYGESLD